MEKKMEVSENTYSWLKVTVANEIVGVFESYVDYRDLKEDVELYETFIMGNQVVDELEEAEGTKMYGGWSAFREAREAYERDNGLRKEGE